MQNAPADVYRADIERYQEAESASRRRWSLLGNLRLIAAFVIAIAAWQWWAARSSVWPGLMLIGLVAFVSLMITQRRAGNQRDRAARFVTAAQRALVRYEQRWANVPAAPQPDITPDHPYARDLNIVGHASLAQRIGSPVTAFGWQALYRALLQESDTAGIRARQAAIAALAPQRERRIRVEAQGRDQTATAPDHLLAWAEGADALADRGWLRALALLGPVLLLVTLIGWALGLIPWVWMLAPIGLNAVVFTVFGARAVSNVHEAARSRDIVDIWQGVAREIGGDATSVPELQRLEAALQGAEIHLGQLGRRLSMVIPRGSLLYFPLQCTVQWDLNVLSALETWRTVHGRSIHGWLEAIGEWEALAALSILKHDHADWAFPDVDRRKDRLSATALAHPLMRSDIAVPNDVVIGPPGTFLFITGSNMSGKSTLLRAVGVNAVLALAGAPVAATALTMPPLRIATCMRVEDSLEEGVSFFMAELQRLKRVMDLVTAPSETPGLYLLDEILQGTNTRERQIASRRILARLVQTHTIGAVSSHDLDLIAAHHLADHAVSQHFSEHFTDNDMRFDYLLRDGIATSSNALALMDMLGFDLGVDEEAARHTTGR